MSERLTAPGIDEFGAEDWEAVARTSDIPTYSRFQTKFGQKVVELETSGPTAASALYRFLGSICFIHLQPDSKDQPLRARWVSTTGRSAAVEDFDDPARDTIEQLVSLATIPLLRARFADMIWLLRKNYKMAEQTAVSYLAAFKAVDDAGHWAYEFDCLKRGMALARMLGPKKQLFLDYVAFVEKR